MRKILRVFFVCALLSASMPAGAGAGPRGGDVHVPSAVFNAGGGSLQQGGGFTVSVGIGESNIEALSGGVFTVNPGIMDSQALAAADLDLAHAFPVPFIPSRGHRRIIFTDLTKTARIRVYTITGEFVAVVEKRGGAGDSVVWEPVVNSAGQPLASGVYVFYIDGPSETKRRGKLMIVK